MSGNQNDAKSQSRIQQGSACSADPRLGRKAISKWSSLWSFYEPLGALGLGLAIAHDHGVRPTGSDRLERLAQFGTHASSIVAHVAVRPTLADRRRPAPGHLEDGRPCRLLFRRALLHGLRHAGDHDDPGDRRRVGLRLHVPDLDCDRHPAGHRHDFVRTDHSRLPVGRRRLHRRARQPGRVRGPGGGRVPADGLHPHRRGVGVLGRCPDDVGLPGPVPLQGRHRGRPRGLGDDRQSARREGVWGRVRDPDLLLRRDDGADRRRGPREERARVSWRRSPTRRKWTSLPPRASACS